MHPAKTGQTYTLDCTMVLMSLYSPSATWTTSSMRPPPIFASISEILQYQVSLGAPLRVSTVDVLLRR